MDVGGMRKLGAMMTMLAIILWLVLAQVDDSLVTIPRFISSTRRTSHSSCC